MRNKWAETGCFYIKKSQTTTDHLNIIKQGYSGQEKQSWTVDDWMKVIFSNQLPVCIGQGNFSVMQVEFSSFPIPQLRRQCGDAKVIFQDDN